MLWWSRIGTTMDRPQSSGFLASSLCSPSSQPACRTMPGSTKIPIDMVEYDHVMLQMNPATYSAPPEEGFYVHGLYLEGCQWDEQQLQLQESSPKVKLPHPPATYRLLGALGKLDRLGNELVCLVLVPTVR